MARILIVEDEVILAMSTQMDLEEMGHSVVGIARESDQAIVLIEAEKPDLILMDIVIQGEINGIALTNIVNHKYGTPVVYGTAHMDSATVERANKTKHFGILFKPYELQKLSSAVHNATS